MKLIRWLVNFLKEVQAEAKKVNWPSREKTIRDTIVVIVFSASVAVFLAGFDYVFGQILQRFII